MMGELRGALSNSEEFTVTKSQKITGFHIGDEMKKYCKPRPKSLVGPRDWIGLNLFKP